VQVSGKNLVRPEDKLFVLTGYNRSVFEVSSVDSDTQLTVVQITGETPRAMPIGSIVADTDVKFQIFRDDEPVISSGTSTAVEDFTSVEATVYSRVVLVDSAASFKSVGAAAGDRLIVTSGTNKGVYLIEDVGVYDTASGTGTGIPELFLDQETKLTLSTPLPTTDASPYRVERWALADNPIYSATATGSVSDQYVQITDALLYDIERDDRLYDVANNTVYEIVGVVGDQVFVDRTLDDNISGLIEIHKLVFEDSEEDSDTRLERLMGYDTVELDIYVPLTIVDTSASITVSGSTATLPGTAASVGDRLVLGSPHGVFSITDVDGDDLTVDGTLPAGAATAETYSILDDFSVSGTTVTVTQENLETIGVRPGDLFEFEYAGDLWEIVILSVSGYTFEMAEDPSVTPDPSSFTGRIFRRETPAKGEVEV
jgi:hypothetical protein